MFLDEGRSTLGVWLPLALADLYAALAVLVRINAANPENVKVPKRSETLASWCLPMLSKSFSEAEKEQEALELLRSVQRLKDRVDGAKNRRE